MYPVPHALDFDCDCPLKQRKNIWHDTLGVHVRYCPLCNMKKAGFYEPTAPWESTVDGAAGMEMGPSLKAKYAAAQAKRELRKAQNKPVPFVE